MKKNLPVFELKIKESDFAKEEVQMIALVDEPAIEIDWYAFSKQFEFKVDKDRRLVTGVFMVADMPIYRHGKVPNSDQEGGYYTKFSKQTIYEIVQKFFRNGNTSKFNIMHSADHKAEGVYIIESLIVDKSRGMNAPEMFKGVSEGSWIGTAKIDNDEIWNDFIKSGNLKGFSVEGLFEPVFEENEDEDTLQQIADMTKGEN